MNTQHSRTLCIAGMGLIGGSLAAAIKARAPHRWWVRGVDRRRGSLDSAVTLGYLDQACGSLAEGMDGADLVVLAVPVQAILEQLAEIGRHAVPGQVVSDVGSTKAGILEAAGREFPEGVAFVGGHPIAGTELTGVENASAGLFETRPCVLTPGEQTPSAAMEMVTELWQDAGAEVLCLDAVTHDQVFALLSHLPHMVAYSLVETVNARCSASHRELAGGGLRDFTRVTRSSPAVWRDICLENREFLLQALDRFSENLQGLRARVAAGDGEDLLLYFQQCRLAKDTLWTP